MKLADVRLSTRDGSTVAAIFGEIDMSNVGEVEVALTSSMPNDSLGLVVDLEGVDYLDSSGIQLMFKLYSALRSRGQTLVLVVPDGSVVQSTFRLAGLSGPIPVAAHADDALARIASRGR